MGWILESLVKSKYVKLQEGAVVSVPVGTERKLVGLVARIAPGRSLSKTAFGYFFDKSITEFIEQRAESNILKPEDAIVFG